jgi:hypothetical protein
MEVADVDKIINAAPPGWRVILVTVPTRAIRVIVEDLNIKFRVEQLDATTWSWRVLSTHVGDEAWEALGEAIQNAINLQARLKEKLKLAQHEQRMARIKAENPHGR